MPGAPEPSGRQLNPTRRTTSCLEDQDKKMPKENSPAEWMPKVHFQTGGIRPISDRHPQAEGNTDRNVSASAWPTLRGLRPWHVGTLFAREPGDLLPGRFRSHGAVRIGKARSRSR